jgi:hypothetical protein
MVSQQSFSAGDQGFQALQLNHEASLSASLSMVSMPLLQTRDICGFHLSICGMVLLGSGSGTDSPEAHAAMLQV